MLSSAPPPPIHPFRTCAARTAGSDDDIISFRGGGAARGGVPMYGLLPGAGGGAGSASMGVYGKQSSAAIADVGAQLQEGLRGTRDLTLWARALEAQEAATSTAKAFTSTSSGLASSRRRLAEIVFTGPLLLSYPPASLAAALADSAKLPALRLHASSVLYASSSSSSSSSSSGSMQPPAFAVWAQSSGGGASAAAASAPAAAAAAGGGASDDDEQLDAPSFAAMLHSEAGYRGRFAQSGGGGASASNAQLLHAADLSITLAEIADLHMAQEVLRPHMLEQAAAAKRLGERAASLGDARERASGSDGAPSRGASGVGASKAPLKRYRSGGKEGSAAASADSRPKVRFSAAADAADAGEDDDEDDDDASAAASNTATSAPGTLADKERVAGRSTSPGSVTCALCKSVLGPHDSDISMYALCDPSCVLYRTIRRITDETVEYWPEDDELNGDAAAEALLALTGVGGGRRPRTRARS